MHDWTLVSILFEWETARTTINLRNRHSMPVEIVAERTVGLHVPKTDEWGRSKSVHTLMGPSELSSGKFSLQLDMQSGDAIEVVAASFMMPNLDA